MPRRLTAREIAADIADRVASGEYPPGSKLPSWPELATLYSVNRSTIYRAMLILDALGVVRGEPGRGVFVPD